jgi:hypothetical protein
MNVGEMTILVRNQAGADYAVYSEAEVRMAIGWALDSLAGLAAEVAGPRMLYEYRADKLLDQGEYRLPVEIRTVKDVINDAFDPPQFYQRIPYSGQSLVETDAFYAPAASIGAYVWWQAHRTLHMRPVPSESEAAKIRIAAYARPPLPRRQEEDLPIPVEAERWIIAKAAALLVPPPSRERLDVLAAQLELAAADLEKWLWQYSASIPPAPLPDGVL